MDAPYRAFFFLKYEKARALRWIPLSPHALEIQVLFCKSSEITEMIHYDLF